MNQNSTEETQVIEHKQVGNAPRNYHPENVEGKTAIVTGGTTGIGRAVAKLLVERGAKVLIFGRDENDLADALEDIGSSGEVYGLRADQSKLDDIQRIFAEADTKLGELDILVNNAAISAGSVAESELEELQYGINSNLFGPIACTREALRRMTPRGRGHIVNIGSMSADLREEENDVYVATKAALQGFSESLRKTINPQGIKLSLIEPGRVGTNMVDATPEEQKQRQQKGELLEAWDIAEAVHYCLTQPARCAVVGIQIRPLNQEI